MGGSKSFHQRGIVEQAVDVAPSWVNDLLVTVPRQAFAAKVMPPPMMPMPTAATSHGPSGCDISKAVQSRGARLAG